MNRIVNVLDALSLLKVPTGTGQITVSVLDDFFPKNTGIYEIAWDHGTLMVKDSKGVPDAHCDVQALSQLITGFASLDSLLLAKKVSIYCNQENLIKIMTPKKLYINDGF